MLRLIPYLAGVASLIGFWRFCRGISTRRTTLVATAVLAASFYPVRHAVEVKPYSTDLLISLAMTSLGWSVWRDLRSYRCWTALIVFATLGVWCSYTAVFPVAGVAMLLGARVIRERSNRIVTVWMVFGLSTLLSWGAMFIAFAGPQARAAAFLPNLSTWRNAFPPLSEPWRIPWWLLDIHTGQMLAYPHGGHDFGSTLTAILVVMGCIRMGRRRARRPLLFLLLAPLPVALIAAAFHRYPYGTSTRVMLYMAPALCLLAGEGVVAALRSRHRIRRGPIVVAAVLAILPLAGMIIDVVKPYQSSDNQDHRRLARRIADGTRAGDRWIVFNSVTPPPMIADLMITRWLQRVAVVRFYLLSYAPVPVRWEPDPQTILPFSDGRVWLIIQRHGDNRFFSEDRLAAYRGALEKSLGPPRETSRISLPNDETWTICIYPPRVRGEVISDSDRDVRLVPQVGESESRSFGPRFARFSLLANAVAGLKKLQFSCDGRTVY